MTSWWDAARARAGAVLAATALAMTLAGCAGQIPVDPEGTLERVREQPLKVGVSPNEPYVDVANQPYSGDEVRMIEDFARHLGTEVTWVVGGEEYLVKELEDGKLDLVAGGITSKTPWTKHVGVTRPYRSVNDEAGKQLKLVLLVPPGENAFLGELEYFLDQTQEMP